MQTTSLHLTSRHGRALALGQLMATKFLDLNATDSWGCKPLDYAVENGTWACAALLLKEGGLLPLHCLHGVLTYAQ